MLSLLILFTLFCLIGYFYFQSLRKSLPPGPTPVPLLGNLPQLARGALAGKSIREVLQEFKKDYGRVFCFWLGPLPTVMVADHELAVQTFVGQGERHTGRLQPFMANFFRKGRGLVISEGQPWLEHRRFVLHTLRDFGLGRNLMEERIRDEIDYACEEIDAQLAASSDGKAIVKPLEAFNVLVGSIINRMILGYRFGPARQQEFFHLKHELDDMLERSSVFDMWVVKLPGFKQRFKMFQGVVGQIVDFVQKNIDERKEKIASGQHVVSEEQPQDLMDAYFVEMKKRKEKGDSETFNEGELTYCILDLWIAGMETTIVTLMWGFSFLLLHPEELKKCQKEIDEVTGGSRPVGLQDRAQLPHLLATVQVGDYTLPSGTILTAQLSLLLSDETNFESPREFRPSRFLHNKELEAKNLPFGIGKRSCLGESLARAELFLILGALLQKYNFEIDPTAPPKMTPVNRFATLNRPCKFNLVVKKRN